MDGRIFKSVSGFYYVKDDQFGQLYQTRARGNFRQKKVKPIVGDFVQFEATSTQDGYILQIKPRRNELVRPLIANIDFSIVVVSAREPNFSAQLLDRFLIVLEAGQIKVLIFATKLDLLTSAEQQKFQAELEIYRQVGYLVETDERNIVDHLADQVAVVMGQTGAGKSTLLNKLTIGIKQETGAISTSLGRGKHTTRTVELLPVGQGLIADTPGFSSFDFNQIKLAQLPKLFPEFNQRRSQCRFRECRHLNEPDCAVKKAVEESEIAESRYQSYLYFVKELTKKKMKNN